jgi:4a-hydroxytetrahydrobiopterin dehydratase
MARPRPLDPAALDAALAAPDAPAWALVGGRLVKEVTCAGFAAALDFVMAVGALAEQADHHPDIDIRGRTVRLALTTHDAGGITELDLDVARRIDALGDGTP